MFGKAWNRIACYLLVFLFALMPMNGLAESEDAGKILSTESPCLTFEMGTKASMNGISVVDLHGTWHEMGRQYGQRGSCKIIPPITAGGQVPVKKALPA